jgi:ribonuclease HI
VLARTTRFSPLCAVEVGEALGLCEALQWVMALGLHNMDFSLDSKLVVDPVNSSASNYSDFGYVISHCRQLLNNYLHNSKIEFSRRQANGVANALAKAALLDASSQTFIEIPPCIYDLLSNEMR